MHASSEARDPKGDTNALDAATERVDHPSESRVTEDANGVESEGHREGMSEQVSVDEADGEAGHGIEPVDIPNKPEMLITMSIELESPNSGEIPHVHLGSTSWHAYEADELEGQADEPTGEMDESRVQTDASNVSNRPEMAGMSCGEGAGMYLATGDAKHIIEETDGIGSHVDTSSGHSDMPSAETDANRSANMMENVSIPQKKTKLPDLPSRSARMPPDKPNGIGDVTDMSSAPTDGPCVETETETAVNEMGNVSTCQTDKETQNSPNRHEITMPELPGQWRKVSIGGDVYVPWNTPVEALGTANRTFAFGQVESGDEAIAPGAEGEMAEGAGNGGGD